MCVVGVYTQNHKDTAASLTNIPPPALRRYFLQLTERKARCVSTALLRLYYGSTKALLTLHSGSIQALLKLCEGSIKAHCVSSGAHSIRRSIKTL
jgi:hypothetical protein